MLCAAIASLLLVAFASGLCPNGNANIKDTDRQFMVNKHNEFRSLTAKGNAVNKNGAKLPAGKNIFKVKWDCELEAEAQKVAQGNADKYCEMEHKNPNPYGENLATGYGKKTSVTYTSEVFPTSVQMWYDELKGVGYTASLSQFAFNTGIGHWSEVVWGSVKRIGCGVAKCGTKYDFNTGNGILTKSIIACEYWPHGNVGNQPLYEVGNPCKVNANCPLNATCDAAMGLCVEGGPNANTQLPPDTTLLAFKPKKMDFSTPGAKGVVFGISQSSDGTVTYTLKSACKTDAACKLASGGPQGSCRLSDGKCVDTTWAKAGCWAC